MQLVGSGSRCSEPRAGPKMVAAGGANGIFLLCESENAGVCWHNVTMQVSGCDLLCFRHPETAIVLALLP